MGEMKTGVLKLEVGGTLLISAQNLNQLCGQNGMNIQLSAVSQSGIDALLKGRNFAVAWVAAQSATTSSDGQYYEVVEQDGSVNYVRKGDLVSQGNDPGAELSLTEGQMFVMTATQAQVGTNMIDTAGANVQGSADVKAFDSADIGTISVRGPDLGMIGRERAQNVSLAERISVAVAPAISPAVQAAQAQVTAAQADVDQLQKQLETAVAIAATAQVQVDAAQAAAPAPAAVQAVQMRLNAAQQTLAVTETNLNKAEAAKEAANNKAEQAKAKADAAKAELAKAQAAVAAPVAAPSAVSMSIDEQRDLGDQYAPKAFGDIINDPAMLDDLADFVIDMRDACIELYIRQGVNPGSVSMLTTAEKVTFSEAIRAAINNSQ